MSIFEDERLMATLQALSIDPDDLIDIGGEAAVFRHGPHHIARISHDWVTAEHVEKRNALLDELRSAAFSFEIPSVERTVCPRGRIVTIERWLEGNTLQRALLDARGPRRELIITAALEASLEFQKVEFNRPDYRDLYWEPPTRHDTWRGFLEARARRSLDLAGRKFSQVDAAALAAPFALSPTKGFVHFDLYPGNLLIDGDRVSAVLDFSGMSLCGDPSFDPLSLAVYLGAEMTRARQPADAAICIDWLRSHGLDPFLEPAERILAAIWSFAQDDQVVADWTKRVLLTA